MRSTEEKHSSDFLYTSVSTPPTELNTHYKQRIKHTLQTKNILGTFLYTHSHIHTCVHSSIHRRETMYTHTNTHVYAHIYLHRTHSTYIEHIFSTENTFYLDTCEESHRTHTPQAKRSQGLTTPNM